MLQRLCPLVIRNLRSRPPWFGGSLCVGLGQIVGQCGKLKPSVEAPISGLFYAGADAGGAGMGTHQAAESGTEVARRVGHFRNKRLKTQ
jgi:hypothetical protein